METPSNAEQEKKLYPLDSDGFLTAPQDWHGEIARTLARNDGLELGEAHWKVIRFLRSHYDKAKTVPTMREVCQGTSCSTRELFALFPTGGPLMQGVKIAGLPKPTGCK